MKLAAVRRFALALPGVTEEPHFHLSSFRVRGKIFVTVPPEGTHLHVFVDDARREPALALHGAFVEKLWWGKKVHGLRVALAEADAVVVKALVRAAWEAKAPPGLRDPKPAKVRSGAGTRRGR
jgi:hypothetical protein